MRKIEDRPYAKHFTGDSLTEQSHRDEVNINSIMAKARRGQMSDYIREHGGHYGDATSLDFYEAQVVVAQAKSMFEDLPASIRNRFKNEPGLFLDFVQDPANEEELIQMKLAKPRTDNSLPVGSKPQPTPEAPAAAAPASETPPTSKPSEKES